MFQRLEKSGHNPETRYCYSSHQSVEHGRSRPHRHTLLVVISAAKIKRPWLNKQPGPFN
jgi:hypothetical protein